MTGKESLLLSPLNYSSKMDTVCFFKSLSGLQVDSLALERELSTNVTYHIGQLCLSNKILRLCSNELLLHCLNLMAIRLL